MKSSTRTLLIFFGIPILIIVLIFLGMVAWYTWQIRTGDIDTRLTLLETYDPDAFSALGGSSQNLSTVDNPTQYIRPTNPSIGAPDAQVTIITFIDFECPFCRRAYATFEQVREKYGPIVRIVFKHYPLEVIHPSSGTAAVAAQCAHEQNAFWSYYQQVFENQQLTDGALTSYASTLGLSMNRFTACREQGVAKRTVEQDLTDGVKIGVRGTPTYIINGTLYEGILSTDAWDKIILDALQSS